MVLCLKAASYSPQYDSYCMNKRSTPWVWATQHSPDIITLCHFVRNPAQHILQLRVGTIQEQQLDSLLGILSCRSGKMQCGIAPASTESMEKHTILHLIGNWLAFQCGGRESHLMFCKFAPAPPFKRVSIASRLPQSAAM